MVFTVITMKKVPNSLKGDLSKWMQEISTGVYVGNFNKRVREQLWMRINESVKNGEATMSYSSRNEIGYDFLTINSERTVIDYDGIPLVLFPKINKDNIKENYDSGYSNASKFRKAKKFQNNTKNISEKKQFVVIDIETDGLNYNSNSIIEIGALKCIGNETYEFNELINYSKELPKNITELTGITTKELSENGKNIQEVLEEFLQFIGDFDLVGYNINFDINFINKSLKDFGKPLLKNKKYDLLKFVKKEKKYLDNYKLQNILDIYGIEKNLPHRALEDAKLTYELSMKVNEFNKVICKQ